jgi:exosome complex protein LRP1
MSMREKKCASDDFPEEMREQMKSFHESLSHLKKALEPLLENYPEVESKAGTSLDKARLDLTTAYTINSLFWMYLITVGEKPRDHDIKRELDRLKVNMERLKQVADKEKAPKIDSRAAKRFVRSALFDPNDDPQPQLPNKKVRFN